MGGHKARPYIQICTASVYDCRGDPCDRPAVGCCDFAGSRANSEGVTARTANGRPYIQIGTASVYDCRGDPCDRPAVGCCDFAGSRANSEGVTARTANGRPYIQIGTASVYDCRGDPCDRPAVGCSVCAGGRANSEGVTARTANGCPYIIFGGCYGKTTRFVIPSIAKRFKMFMIASGNHTIAHVEGSSQYRNCFTDIRCEDPSTSLRMT